MYTAVLLPPFSVYMQCMLPLKLRLLVCPCRSYTAKDDDIVIPIGVGVCGNVVIVVHHIRAIPIVKMSGRVSISVSRQLSPCKNYVV